MKIKQIPKLFVIFIMILMISFVKVQAASTNPITPTADQYLELRATTITEVVGQNKQVIFELWGYNVDFKRF